MVLIKKKPFFRNRKFLIPLAILVALGGIVIALEKTHVINLYTKDGGPYPGNADTTSDTITAREDFNDGEYRDPGNSLIEDEGSADITDNGGEIDNNTDTNNPIVSNTGEITLYTPRPNASVKSGYQIAGASTLPVVSYRLIDSVSGLIAMGELSVVNGRFAGNVKFSTSAKEGRLDIYGTKTDGSEFSNVEISIRFAQ